LILFINAVLTLNFDAALKFYLTVDWGKVLDPTIITAAASQIIFSLGVGYGIMLTYASYSRQDHKIFQSAIVVALADSIVALTAGLTIFSTVFSFGLNPQAGPLLAFEALPLAFFNMPFGGALLSIFFLLLFIAAITSAVSIIELLITNIEDTFNSDRKSASLYAALFLFLISIPSALSYAVPHLAIGGVPFLDFMDGVVTEKFAPLAVFITVVYIGYLYKDLEKVARKEIPTFYLPIFFIAVRYIVPLFLLAISLTQFFHN
jgi:NSS family neurotransmitter:Na+ symporter